MKHSQPKLSEELLEMQREVIRLQNEVIKLKDELHSADRSNFSTTVRKELRTYSTVLSQNCSAAVAPKRLQAALKRATSDTEDIDRSKNLIVFGLPEADNEDDAETRRRVGKVFNHLDTSPSITATARLGTKREGRHRPVKISLQQREDLVSLLKKARLLHQADTFKQVYLSPDLTREEREDNARLYQTLKQLRKDNPGRKYWVRGGSIMCDV